MKILTICGLSTVFIYFVNFEAANIFINQDAKVHKKCGLEELLKQYPEKKINQYPAPAKSEKELFEKVIESFTHDALDQKPYVMVKLTPEKDIPFIASIFRNNWEQLCCSDKYDEKMNAERLNRILDFITNNRSSNKCGYDIKEVQTKVIKHKSTTSDLIETIGFINYVLYKGDSRIKWYNYYFFGKKDLTGHIEVIGVDENHRRNKLGTSLLNYAIKNLTAKGAQSVNLFVWNQNEPAKQCYQKLGFKFLLRYSHTTDIMVKE